ncbi:hypothetical protein ACFVVM_16840 [Nocardia sp. NPDC058176]|uniref:hypothetical protein n=1 Tax=Nocardia sp. NPDC058176 TaxID=3346368 RepID=UPI0036DB9129
MSSSEFVKYQVSVGLPLSPLGVVRAGFARIAQRPLPTDPATPPSPVTARGPVESWDRLRELLWDPAVPIAEIDAIWVWLIERARARGEDAMLVCAGMAVPMLAKATGEFAAPGSPHRHDHESEVLTGFFAYLDRVELDRPGVWHRLRWAAYRATRKAATQQHTGAMAAGDVDADLGPLATHARSTIAEPGHPEAVLADAVAAAVISERAAELIAVTRCGQRTLTSLATERGESLWKLAKQRQRAERALLAWITERALDVDLDPSRTSAVEAHAVNTLPPRADRSLRRGRRQSQNSLGSRPSSTGRGQVAA